MGFVITVLAICIIVLYLLGNSNSSIASSRFDPSKSITERKHDELVTISNRHEKEKEKEKEKETEKEKEKEKEKE
jgi:hypothetical protein